MRIIWVTRSFLDYRIPVFKALSDDVGGNFKLLYSGDYVPERVQAKVQAVLGDAAVPLTGEWKLGREDREFLANRNVSLRWQPGLRRRLRAEAPDVVVTDGFFKWALPCLLHRIRCRTPLVICYERTAHTERHAQGVRRWYRRWAVRQADAMCCNGRLCGEYTASLGMPRERMTLGHMAADTEGLSQAVACVAVSERSALRDRWQARGAVFLYVGRLIPRKGLRELLAAWARATWHASDPTLCLVGEGPLRSELESFCQRHALTNVHFAGAIPYDDLARYYAGADALIMPTLEDNWSLVVPEAMACGLPILCSTYNGCWPELVREGENGWVFDPLNANGTIRALEAMTLPSVDLTAMGAASQRIISEHTPRHAAAAVHEACRMAFARRPQPVS